jgi:hypothetical protein
VTSCTKCYTTSPSRFNNVGTKAYHADFRVAKEKEIHLPPRDRVEEHTVDVIRGDTASPKRRRLVCPKSSDISMAWGEHMKDRFDPAGYNGTGEATSIFI